MDSFMDLVVSWVLILNKKNCGMHSDIKSLIVA